MIKRGERRASGATSNTKFAHMRFEPSGQTNDADIRIAKSIVDNVFR